MALELFVEFAALVYEHGIVGFLAPLFDSVLCDWQLDRLERPWGPRQRRLQHRDVPSGGNVLWPGDSGSCIGLVR